jgi:hypothetical protein
MASTSEWLDELRLHFAGLRDRAAILDKLQPGSVYAVTVRSRSKVAEDIGKFFVRHKREIDAMISKDGGDA